MHWRRKWQPTPVFLPGESQGQGNLVGFCLWGRTELNMTEVTQQQQQEGKKKKKLKNGALKISVLKRKAYVAQLVKNPPAMWETLV